MQLRLLPSDDCRVSRLDDLAQAAARALALFFGGFTLVNMVGGWMRSNFDANLWWIDLRVLPQFPAQAILLPGALIAGVMGMNFKVGLFDNPSFFWVAVAAIVAIAPVAIVLAKRWNWI